MRAYIFQCTETNTIHEGFQVWDGEMTKRGDDLGVILGLPYFFKRLLMAQPLFFRHI